jgi:hypothetical protein
MLFRVAVGHCKLQKLMLLLAYMLSAFGMPVMRLTASCYEGYPVSRTA